MHFYTYKEFTNVFKKRNKMFVLVFIFLFSLCIIANKTFFKDKINIKYSVIFDYEFHYSWTSFTKQSFEFDKTINSLVCPKTEIDKTNCIQIPFSTLLDLHATFFELIFRFNLEDLKSNDFLSPRYKLAKAFNFDTPNFVYQNRKLHIAWSDLKEAEGYLQNLHDRATFEILTIIKIIYNTQNNRTINEVKNRIIMFPSRDVGELIKKEHQLNNDLELEQFVKKIIDDLKTNEINDADLFKFIFSKELFYPHSLLAFPFSNHDSDDDGSFRKIFSTKRDIIYYYLGTKYNSFEKIKKANLVFLPDTQKLVNNFENYLPTYELIVKNVNRYYIYLIEILIAFLISFLIIFTLHIDDRVKFINKTRKN